MFQGKLKEKKDKTGTDRYWRNLQIQVAKAMTEKLELENWLQYPCEQTFQIHRLSHKVVRECLKQKGEVVFEQFRYDEFQRIVTTSNTYSAKPMEDKQFMEDHTTGLGNPGRRPGLRRRIGRAMMSGGLAYWAYSTNNFSITFLIVQEIMLYLMGFNE